jgi:hypothetical protein
VLLTQSRQALFYDRPPGPPKNVTDKEDFQDSMVTR